MYSDCLDLPPLTYKSIYTFWLWCTVTDSYIIDISRKNMKIVFLNRCSAVLGMSLLFSAVGQTVEVDVYGGFGAGHAVQKQLTGDDTTDTGEKAYIGTRFLGPLGIEISYYNLGKYNNATKEVTIVSAAAVASLDIRGMTLFAKGGVIEWTEKDLSNDTKIKGEDFAYGIGINLPVDKHVLFRTELEYFKHVGKDDSTNTPGKDMSMLSFGVNFQF